MNNIKPEFLEYLKSGDFTILSFDDEGGASIFPGKHSPDELEYLINNDQIEQFSEQDILIDPDGERIYILETFVKLLGGEIVYV